MRFVSSIKLLIVVVFVSTFFVGCYNDVGFNTTYVLRPTSEDVSGGVDLTISGVTGYAFAVDTADWHVASYDDALAGILTSRSDPNEKYSHPLAIMESYGVIDTIPDSKNWLRMSVDVPSVFVLAVSTEQRLYGYRQQSIYENLGYTYTSIIFHPWKEVNHYVAKPWLMYNEFYTPPPTTLCILKPSLQVNDGDIEVEEVPISDIKAFAFAVDTTYWRVASYKDAVAGVLTSKGDPTVTYSDKLATMIPYDSPDSKNWLSAEIKNISSALILVVNTGNESYGYQQQNFIEDKQQVEQVDIPIVFKPWRVEAHYIEEPWRMFNPPPTTLCILKPTLQETEGGEEVSVSNIKAFAFAVSTTDWKVASYEDAEKGILTSVTNDEEKYSERVATMVSHGDADSPNWLSAKIRETSSALILVVNTKDKSYGYQQQNLIEEGKQIYEMDIPIVFRLWRGAGYYDEEPWRMFNSEVEAEPEL